MYGNKRSRLIMVVICIGCLLFTTACSRYVSRSSMNNRSTMDFTMDNVDDNNHGVRECIDRDLLEKDKNEWRKAARSLMKAIIRKDINKLKEILKHVKDKHKKDPDRQAICLMLKYESVDVFESDNDLDSDETVTVPVVLQLFYKAISIGDLSILSILFEIIDCCDSRACEEVLFQQFGWGQYTIMHQAVESWNSKIVEYFVSLYIKIKKKSGTLVEVLSLRNGAGETPLSMAFKQFIMGRGSDGETFISIVKNLLQCNTVSNQASLHNIFVSTIHGVMECGDINVMLVIEIMSGLMGRDLINSSDSEGYTLLHYAVMKRKHMIAEHLIKLGASCTVFNKNGISPLLIAIRHRDPRMTKLLLSKKDGKDGSKYVKDINKPGKFGITPLDFAVDRIRFAQVPEEQNTVYDIVEALLNAGADLLISDNLGAPLLHKVIRSRDTDLVNLLLKFGANPLAKDLKGNNSFDIAVDQAFVKPPKEKGSDINMISIITTMLCNLTVNSDFMKVYLDVQSTYMHDNPGRCRDRWVNAIGELLKKYGVSLQTTPPSKVVKRPCDFVPSYINPNKRRKRMTSVNSCGDSSGRAQGN